MHSSLTEEDRLFLLGLAREALEAAAHARSLPPLDLESLPEQLRAPGAAFVTLTIQESLRGCIGALEATLPLAEDVRQHAFAAALSDFRFTPVRPEETESIEIEISILTTPQLLHYSDPAAIPRLLRPGVDGVIVRSGMLRATFLPQVWDKVQDAEQFLGMLCQKAGLPAESWQRGDLEVLTYQVVSFHEGAKAG